MYKMEGTKGRVLISGMKVLEQLGDKNAQKKCRLYAFKDETLDFQERKNEGNQGPLDDKSPGESLINNDEQEVNPLLPTWPKQAFEDFMNMFKKAKPDKYQQRFQANKYVLFKIVGV